MKKRHFLAFGAAVALLASCNGGSSISTKATLNTAVDSLSYAYGIDLVEKGLMQYLGQLGVYQDTAEFRMNYEYRIQMEADSAKKLVLRKEMTAKVDSVSKANVKNMKEFLAGLNEAYNADKSKDAYMRGVEIGGQLKQITSNITKQLYGEETDKELNKKALLAGLVAKLKNEKLMLEDAGTVVTSKSQAIQEARLKEENAEVIAAAEKFLAENKTKPGVVTLPSGLQYEVITEGTGAKPVITDQVKVHYHGTLLDGTVFDSSVNRGEPATFGVGQVIKGWTEALLLMPVGSKWKVYVPADLAYGAQATGAIKPFSTLIFEVELLDIEKK